MINTRKFLVEHLDQIVARDVYSAFPWVKDQYTKLSSRNDVIMYTIFDGEIPLAVVGGNYVWDGFYQAWGILSDNVTKRPISFTKEIKRIINIHFKELGLHRISIEVKADFCSGLKWLEVLGFRAEGTMRQWGPDKSDYVLFARIA